MIVTRYSPIQEIQHCGMEWNRTEYNRLYLHSADPSQAYAKNVEHVIIQIQYLFLIQV
jgi:hypothetical protein